jgi:hypothetical protein
MISWIHAQFFHDGFEFFPIIFSVGTEHRKVPKESNVIDIAYLIWVHAGQARHTIEIIIAAPIHIAISTRTNYARMCLIKFVIGSGSGSAPTSFGDEFSGTHCYCPAVLNTLYCAELCVPNSNAVNGEPTIVTLFPAPE